MRRHAGVPSVLSALQLPMLQVRSPVAIVSTPSQLASTEVDRTAVKNGLSVNCEYKELALPPPLEASCFTSCDLGSLAESMDCEMPSPEVLGGTTRAKPEKDS